MDFLIGLWMATSLSTFIVGNWRAYRHQVSVWNDLLMFGRTKVKRPTVRRFIVRQLIGMALAPKQAFVLIIATLFLSPLMLMLILMREDAFDMAQCAWEESDLRRRETWKQREGSEWRIISADDAVAYRDDAQTFIEEYYRFGDLVEQISIMMSKAGSFAALLLGLLFAPMAMFVPKASGQTRSRQTSEQAIDPKEAPFDPGLTGTHGAIGAGYTLTVPTDGQTDPALVWQLRQMDLKFLPRISDEMDGTVVLGLAKFVVGHTDPVLVASMSWKPSDDFTLTGGRILNPVGLSRQLPPHLLIELAYANTGVSIAPFFEHGAMAQWRPTDALELGLGLLSGHGTSLESDGKPDLVLLARIRPSPMLTLGLDTQTGPQPEGWRHVVGAHARLDHGLFYGQAEAVAAFDAGQDEPTVGWYVLGALRPTQQWEPYARVEALNDDLITLLGANYKPAPGVALRAAASVPLTRTPPLGFQLAAQVAF